MTGPVLLSLGFGVLALLLVVAGHALSSPGRRVLGGGRTGPTLAAAGVLAAVPLAVAATLGQDPEGKAVVNGALLATCLLLQPLAVALRAEPAPAGTLGGYAGWWAAAGGGMALVAAGTVAAAGLAAGPAAGAWWRPDDPRSAWSYAVGAVIMLAVLRGSLDLVRFVRRTRAAYTAARVPAPARLRGPFYPLVAAAAAGVALAIAVSIPLTLAEPGAGATLAELLVKAVPSLAAAALAAFLARLVAAAEPSARMFTLLCLLFAVAANELAPPGAGQLAESVRFAALVAAAPVTVHFALVFPVQDEAVPHSVARHWAWVGRGRVLVPWPVYLPLAAAVPVAAAAGWLSQAAAALPVAAVGLLVGPYLLTGLAPAVAGYAFASTWQSLSRSPGPPEAVARVREQLAWVALGGVLAGVSSLLWTLLTPQVAAALGDWSVTAYWSCALLLPLGVTLAMLQHRLWDVQRLLNYALVHSGTLALVAVGQAAVFGAADGLIKRLLREADLPEGYAAVAAFLMAAAVYNPLNNWVRARVDRLFARWLKWPARAG